MTLALALSLVSVICSLTALGLALYTRRARARSDAEVRRAREALERAQARVAEWREDE